MVHLVDDGGVGTASSSPTTSTMSAPAASAYKAAKDIAVAERTSTQQQIVDDGDAALAAVTADWTAGQQAVEESITDFITGMQLDVQRVARKNMRRDRSLTEQGLNEILSVITYHVGKVARVAFELQGP